MKTSRFTEEQMAFAIKQHELGARVEEICRKMGISDPTFYKWRQKYAGLGPSVRSANQDKLASQAETPKSSFVKVYLKRG